MPALERLAALYPWGVDASDDLRRALDFLGRPAEPETVVRAGYGIGLAGLGVSVSLWLLVPVGLTVLLVSCAVTLLAVHVVHETPAIIALARRTRALGTTPDLVARTVLSMRLAPSPERAAEFAATSGESTLARSLTDHVHRARTTGQDPLLSFSSQWEEWYPALGKSMNLVVAAGEMTGADRDRMLDRALSVVLDGTRTQMRSFAASIHRPVTALYAFGVLLPTALVALLPAAHAAGVGVTTATVVVVYDVVLPVGLLGAAVWLVVRRPVAFPPPNVGRDHPDVPERRRHAALAGVGTGLIGVIAGTTVLPVWATPIVVVGPGAGVALWVYFRPVVAVYERIRAIESGLTDALTLIGRRVANGVAVESALQAAASDLDGDIGDVLDRAVTRQRTLRVGIRDAFLGDHGALADVPSPRVRGSVAVLGLAARKGQPVGSAILALADHVDDLSRVEDESRHDLQSVCGTLSATGALFGPMVAGATVAMADGLSGQAGLAGSAQSLPWLGLAVGGYVLAFAAILPALAASLERGFDGPLVGHRVGRALVSASLVYLGSYLLVAGVA